VANKGKELLNTLKNGLWESNPVFIQLLGLCPTLAITTSVSNGLGMGLCSTFVLVFSNFFISVLRKFIPPRARIASYIVIIAGFVTVIDLVLKAFLYELSASLGVFIPLIVVNCIFLARAESFASKNKPFVSVVDGFSMGLGFTAALVIISAIRELLGNGTLLGFRILPEAYQPALILILPAGGFLVLGLLTALVRFVTDKTKKDREDTK